LSDLLTRTSLPHRCCSLLACIWYVMIVMNVSLPTELLFNSDANIAKDSSVPFPCQSKSCGCRSAEQCYRNCCCHTPAERRAFAEQHGLKSVELGIPDEETEPTHRQTKSCCAAKQSTPVASCCSKPKESCCSPQKSSCSSPKVATKSKSLCIMSALKCQGQGMDLLSIALALLPEPRVEIECTEQSEELTIYSLRIANRADLLDTPPPRV
jgi:hypothetical protein